MLLTRRRAIVMGGAGLLTGGLGVFARAQTVRLGFDEAWGSRFRTDAAPDPRSAQLRAPAGDDTVGRIRYWSQLALDASGLDHTPLRAGESRVFGEQFGPGRASRAMAIVHIAIFDAANVIGGGYQGYTGLTRTVSGGSIGAAVARAAHDTLVALYPSQRPQLDTLLAEDLARMSDGSAKTLGVELGRAAAASILEERTGDGSEHREPRMGSEHVTSEMPGKWRQDPIGRQPIALGAYWSRVRPFVMSSADQFRSKPMPGMDSREYAEAYDEVRRLGGDGVTTATERTAEQTRIGIFWAYDGTPSLCAPPRLYNQAALAVMDGARIALKPVAFARLLALVNVAMADVAIATFESKYFYDCWRPVIGIREADEGTGPTGIGDGNTTTICDPRFTPLGAPASNLTGPNFTPPFPAYPGGHAAFGGALFQALRNYYGTDSIPFTLVSDEYNGITRDNAGNVRPMLPRTFRSLSEAEEENGQSRTYLGIHWVFDKTEGIVQGRNVADWVFQHAFAPCGRLRC